MQDVPVFPPHIAALRAYVPGLPIEALARQLAIEPGRIAQLASNENPLGPSPRALRAMVEAAIDFSRYPDTDCVPLVGALAERHGVPAEWIVVGAGSESLLGLVASAMLCQGRKALYPRYAFQAFVNAVQKAGATGIAIDEPELRVELAGMREGLSRQPSLVYIANPGNPTGTWLEPGELAEFLTLVPPHVVVLLDEAYVEFLPDASQTDAMAWVRQYPNLVVTRTFSKAYGLAGLRVGYAIAQPGLADMLRRVRSPFTVTTLAQAAAEAALEDQPFLERTLANNREAGQLLRAGLEALGLRVLPSATNFLMAEVSDGQVWARRLQEQALIVRPVGNYGLPTWLRISIGTPDESRRLLRAMEPAVAKAR